MAKLVGAQHLECCVLGRKGSSPFIPTKNIGVWRNWHTLRSKNPFLRIVDSSPIIPKKTQKHLEKQYKSCIIRMQQQWRCTQIGEEDGLENR